jgi:putative ABC transport system permease protein
MRGYNVQLHPILSSVWHNRVGAVLIAAEIAVILAILCNALFVIQQRFALGERPSGVDEMDVFVISNQWTKQSDDLESRIRTDLTTVRSLPSVVDAYVTNAYPLENGGWGFEITLNPEKKDAYTDIAVYFADEHGLNTLDLKLIAGRNFQASEISTYHAIVDRPPMSGIIVTRALADRLLPGGNVLGRIATISPTSQSGQIVGIVDRLQAPWVTVPGPAKDIEPMSAVLPYRFICESCFYVVRARSGTLPETMKTARNALIATSRERVIDSVRSLREVRRDAYRRTQGIATALITVSLIMLAVMVFGIFGLTSYWVTQRRREVGIRRALGATRMTIVHHFQIENLLISGVGVTLGAALGIAANLWMIRRLEVDKLPLIYVAIGALAVLLLGQIAVLWPALRAASVPPATAARSA